MNQRKTALRQRRRRRNLIFTIIIISLSLTLISKYFSSKNNEINLDELIETQITEINKTASVSKSCRADFPVHVAGAVKKPGVYFFTKGTIVAEAIKEAGGLEKNAAVDMINMAALLNAHDKLYIPTREEASAANYSNNAILIENQDSEDDSKIDLNTASEAELTEIPGIGPATAKAIIDYRDKHGPFKKLEELMKVSGIKDKKFSRLEPYLCIG